MREGIDRVHSYGVHSHQQSKRQNKLTERSKTMDYNKAFAELASNKRMLEELKAIIAEQEDAIKAQLVADGKTEYIGTEHKASYKEVVSNRFDSKAFKADGYKELYEAYQKPSTSMRFDFA